MSQGVSIIYKEPNTEKKYITFLQVPSPISDDDPVDEYFCKRLCELHEWDYVEAKKEPVSTRELTAEEKAAGIIRQSITFLRSRGVQGNPLSEAHAIMMFHP